MPKFLGQRDEVDIKRDKEIKGNKRLEEQPNKEQRHEEWKVALFSIFLPSFSFFFFFFFVFRSQHHQHHTASIVHSFVSNSTALPFDTRDSRKREGIDKMLQQLWQRCTSKCKEILRHSKLKPNTDPMNWNLLFFQLESTSFAHFMMQNRLNFLFTLIISLVRQLRRKFFFCKYFNEYPRKII